LTDLGEDLVLGRFGDAVAALAALDGVRVHRSFWVRRSAVCSVRPQGKGLLLTLSNGAEIPVSQAYREIAKQAGFNVDA
jgi:DNA-binding LytR/AlgR family response regulator